MRARTSRRSRPTIPRAAFLTKHSRAARRTGRNVMGRLGPRGVTSLVFAVLAYVSPGERDAALVLRLAASTVLLSVILHGVTAEPLARWLGRRAGGPGREDGGAADG
ncbi:hypothetical protein [Streptomyces litmocidini]|uniref:Cation/H+ exchanger domain-containing protein n=1 Tax=Streptomyces litmocidini TaxID=67318 RepID=A0ABW7TXT6_9ACTN